MKFLSSRMILYTFLDKDGKLINLRMVKIDISILDVQRNPYAIRDVIVNHRGSAECKDCEWFVAVVGGNSLNAFAGIDQEKECLAVIDTELELLGNTIELLVKEYGFSEYDKYKPDIMKYRAKIYVYCELKDKDTEIS